MEMRQKTLQSHCNNVRRQLFYDTKTVHEPDIKHSEQSNVFEKMKEKTEKTNEQSIKIVLAATTTVTRECAVVLPKYKSLTRSIKGKRGWENKPTTLKDAADPTK